MLVKVDFWAPANRIDGAETEGENMADRTASGRFAPGNAGGPGRPRRAVEVDYLACIENRMDTATWAAVIDKAIEQAKAGDAAARAWLSKYLSDAALTEKCIAAEERITKLVGK